MLFTSNELLSKLKQFEGLRLEAYEDAAGVLTIGYGHTHNVLKGDKISEYCADEYLRMDMETAQRQVMELGVVKTQGELDALVSFVFNLGISRLKTSTLLKLIKAKMPREVVMKEFRKWCYADGKRLPGLYARRSWEAARFFEKTDKISEVEEKMLAKQSGIVSSIEEADEYPEEYCEV